MILACFKILQAKLTCLKQKAVLFVCFILSKMEKRIGETEIPCVL